MKLLRLLALALGFLAVCNTSSYAAPAAASTPAAKPASRHKLFMWKVTGDKGTIFLVGSIHMVRADFYPLPGDVEKAFQGSDRLVVEINPNKEEQSAAQKVAVDRGTYGQDETIYNHVSKATIEALAKYLKSAPDSEQGLVGMKPWLVSIMIPMAAFQRKGFDPERGIDKHFMDQANKAAMPVNQLETALFQVDLLSGFPDDVQEKLLLSSLVDVQNTDRDASTMVHAWKTGDAAEMDSIITRDEAEHPDLKSVYGKLLYDRNVGMLGQLEPLLQKSGSAFVVVGAAHLVGERGLIRLLQDKKYAVEQIVGN
jgi:uncharacterized protein YbaP (TraB family)